MKNKQILTKHLNDDLFCDSILLSTLECYLHHIDNCADLSQIDKDRYLASVGGCLNLIRNINDLKSRFIIENGDPQILYQLEGEKRNLEIEKQNLPGIQFLENLPQSCNAEFFFEALCNATRLSAINQQSLLFKQETVYEQIKIKEINILKQDSLGNQNAIFEKEFELATYLEGKLKLELMERKKFETLNSEKITPYFMSLVKGSKVEAKLDEITREDGTEFANNDDRVKYIVDTFGDLYKKPPGEVIDVNCIENFLGDLTENNVIKNSKLKPEQKIELENDLTIEELDKSIDEANLKSAPGADGFSNKFIKKFWHLFRAPLMRLAAFCYDRNSLTDSFRNANIRLIPKKGNLKLLKNWRPISLLNCFYKVISRAISNRLKTVMDQLTPVCQKGYSTTRRCQEVLLNVIEGIEECKRRGLKGALLSLDIRKAFDTLGHRYIDRVLTFYNFGENFKKWVTLLSTNRMACIILEGGHLSHTFNLERGNAQGDIISPFIFLLGYQILLFKLQFDLQTEGIIAPPIVPVGCPPLPHQVISSAPKVLAMADDATLLVKLNINTPNRIKEILRDFGNISGLLCNLEKTVVIPIGITAPLENEIIETGFSFDQCAIILGMEISNTLGNFETAAGKIRSALNKEINFWARFRLSLPGRVNIAKSMLYSQLNYTGSFLPFSSEQIGTFSKIIEQFVRGNLKIAKDRIFLDKKLGGLGLVPLKNFLNCQKCGWFKLILKLDDHWKQIIFYNSYGNIFNARKCWYPDNIILSSFCKSLEILTNCSLMFDFVGSKVEVIFW